MLQKILEFLNENKITFKLVEHKKIKTCKEMAEVLKCKEREIAKCILLKTKNEYILVILPGNKSVNKKYFEKLFNTSVELAKPSEIKNKFSCEIGAVHPFLNKCIKTFYDKDILKNEEVYISPGTNKASIKLKAEDVIKLSGAEEMKNNNKKEKNVLGMTTTRKENFSQWYLEVVRKGGFKDQRTPIKGFDVILPWGYAVWEELQKIIDNIFKAHGIKNCYFPLLFPESFIKKETEHFKGFEPETVKVTEVGDENLNEALIIRPTSETIMYYMFSKWIRSYRDLPLKINQWCNVVRWDTKITKPFIRDREFLWQELHTVHSTKEDALRQIHEIVKMCKEIHYYLAMEALIMKRTPNDTFPGAEFTIAFDTLVQDYKVFQGPGCHFLGQNFSKAFNIKFIDKHGKKQYAWQTCLGITTREIGGIIMQHGDDKGAVLPPLLAPIQFVIIPILFKGEEEIILQKAKEIEKMISKHARAHLDLRDYSPGFKFNDWELKGVPFRIEIGPREVKENKVTMVRRDTNEKIELGILELKKEKLNELIHQMQNDMYEKSKEFLKTHITNVCEFDCIKEYVRKGIVRANWCGNKECEEKINAVGVEVRGIRFDKNEKPFDKCIVCGKDAKHVIYIARAY